MRDLFGEVPVSDVGILLDFCREHARFRTTKHDRKRAATMLKTWSVEEIQAGIVWGTYRAREQGKVPRVLVYYEWAIKEVVSAAPGYVEYLIRKAGHE